MNRVLFLQQPARVRMARYLRRRNAESMAQPNQRLADPSERPLNVHRVWFMVCVFCSAVALYVGEGLAHRRVQAVQGIYNVTPVPKRPLPDCSAEGREICKVQSRMSKVKA